MTLKAQAIFSRPSGFPRDRVVNTWYFGTTSRGKLSGDGGLIRGMLDQFYYGDLTGISGVSGIVGEFFASTLDALEYRVYDLTAPEPREPEILPSLAFLRAASTAVPLPAEVACCLSFFANQNSPRGRGRVYLGPLSSAINSLPTGGTDTVVSATFRTRVVAAAARLRDLDDAAGLPWVQVSQATGTALAKIVTDVYVDDGWDTQRRRGARPSTRTRNPAS